MNAVVAGLKMAAFALIVILVIPTQGLFVLLYKGPATYYVPQLWHNCVRLIFGIKYRIEGTPFTDSQTLYISNHLSYLDISTIGSILRASFVAKKDVESWPLFGLLSKLQQTAFISRDRADAAKAKSALVNMIAAGKSLIIFPEGTSTDGRNVLPFKSSLFSLALHGNNENLYIQPVTIALETVDGHEVKTQEDRDLYAWHVDMTTELHHHLWRFAQSKGASLVIKFHPPLKASDYKDRKILAKACHDHVSNGLETKQAA